jgi:hypothetical protein
MIGSSIEAERIISNSNINAPLTGTIVSGGDRNERMLRVSNETISIEPVVHIAAVQSRRCGTAACGNKS